MILPGVRPVNEELPALAPQDDVDTRASGGDGRLPAPLATPTGPLIEHDCAPGDKARPRPPARSRERPATSSRRVSRLRPARMDGLLAGRSPRVY